LNDYNAVCMYVRMYVYMCMCMYVCIYISISQRILHQSIVGRDPPQPVSVLGPAATQSPSFLMAQAIFQA
jgi:hypothetical protein